MAISAMLKTKLDKLRADLNKNQSLCKIENTIRVPKEYLVLVTLGVLAICLATGHGAAFICNVAGFLYPAQQSFKALESGGKRDATTQWLTYWLIYSALTIPETFSSLLAWIPFYYIFKCFFLLWCFMPQTRGAYTIYEHVLKGMLSKSEAKIDQVMNKAHTKSHSNSGSSSSNSDTAAAPTAAAATAPAPSASQNDLTEASNAGASNGFASYPKID